jgi:RNA-binding protein
MTLHGFQRQYLKALAHDLSPVVQVGKDGVTPPLLAQIEAALLAHELIKVRLTRPEDKHGSAEELAEQSGAMLVGLIGHTVILYRPHPEKPRIRLPERDAAPE